jgi:transposase
MSNRRYTPEFKDEAVRQVVERGYRIAEVAERLGVSTNSLHKWVKSVKPNKADERATELNDAKKEILELRAELRRVQEERDILKKAARYFASQPE